MTKVIAVTQNNQSLQFFRLDIWQRSWWDREGGRCHLRGPVASVDVGVCPLVVRGLVGREGFRREGRGNFCTSSILRRGCGQLCWAREACSTFNILWKTDRGNRKLGVDKNILCKTDREIESYMWTQLAKIDENLTLSQLNFFWGKDPQREKAGKPR